ncbi:MULTISPECIES: dTMP kinase [unclassified Arsukibacterium]|uniref:dTMP kinase n=1 Tax=unclassified Arsukibacterium TaxID=2635278 RepID=UPI000C8FC620|nr:MULTISPECIES: dTMP kinase [unclassified Arsukibacterium]MAA95274.1 dTMP kinase [Rheinheimera sp.]HAW93667.1 dTMP kinase [Candidatus Azambacteria bacterium]|tara:strand:+ start:687 stop:1328 length:642 start_codon:yes stop_codon:yes gene_type:complete
MTNPGRFIVVEGLEGAGKSSAIATIRSWLLQRQLTVVCTREPGGTPLAEQLRTLVKQVDNTEILAPQTELLLMYAARVQLLTNVIRPALGRGDWVLADRHDMSSRAYQGGGRQLDEQLINNLRNTVLGNTRPDLTLYLDIDPAIGLSRAAARGELDRIEQEQLAFFIRTRQKYRQIAATEPDIITIDASQPLAEVQQAITAALQNHFAGHADD